MDGTDEDDGELPVDEGEDAEEVEPEEEKETVDEVDA